jgi:hypothetical protein
MVFCARATRPVRLSGWLVYLVCLVCLVCPVYLVYLVGEICSVFLVN